MPEGCLWNPKGKVRSVQSELSYEYTRRIITYLTLTVLPTVVEDYELIPTFSTKQRILRQHV